jgi:hypothetical protein
MDERKADIPPLPGNAVEEREEIMAKIRYCLDRDNPEGTTLVSWMADEIMILQARASLASTSIPAEGVGEIAKEIAKRFERAVNMDWYSQETVDYWTKEIAAILSRHAGQHGGDWVRVAAREFMDAFDADEHDGARVDRAIDTLRKALASSPPPQQVEAETDPWQLISTHDGSSTPVLVYCADWHYEDERISMAELHDNGCWHIYLDGQSCVPTHFMPLPAPPKAEP